MGSCASSPPEEALFYAPNSVTGQVELLIRF
jgi:hypothetical protein